MGAEHWSAVGGGLSPGSQVAQGPTAGLGPVLDGTYCYGALNRSTVGTWCRYTSQAAFAPVTLGGKAEGLLRRGHVPTARPGAAPFLFVAAQPPPHDPEGPVPPPEVDAWAYKLGLSDEGETSRVVLAKGPLALGVPASPVGTDGVLGRGSIEHPVGAWVHLSLMVAVSPTGDVTLKARWNDLSSATHAIPTWLAVPGIDEMLVDDVLGANTGTTPLIGGFMGFGAHHGGEARLASFDFMKMERQL